MREEFYDIYADLSRSYEAAWRRPSLLRYVRAGRAFPTSRSPLAGSGPRWISEGIDRAVSGSEARLRPDARYFLLSSFWEMVVLPVLHPRNPIPVDVDELRVAILQDVETLVRTARERRGAEEITGGDILKVTTEAWERLRINNIRFWGAREDGR